MSATKARTGSVHQLKVTLKGTTPPVWRRLLVSSDTTLSALHDIIQVAMGWDDYHLHQFVVAGNTYGRDGGGDWGPRPQDEGTAKLGRVAPTGSRFTYEYDFGDSWEHDIVVEKVLPRQADKTYPVCLSGRRACPPEDCGGAWGYAELLEAVRDPAHDQHQELLEWLGGAFDPESFDVATVNRHLAGKP